MIQSEHPKEKCVLEKAAEVFTRYGYAQTPWPTGVCIRLNSRQCTRMRPTSLIYVFPLFNRPPLIRTLDC